MWRPTLPPFSVSLWLAPLLVIFVFGAGALCGWLKVRRGLRTGDTRKIFHFAVFMTAAALVRWSGIEAVNLLGGAAAVYIAIVLFLGEGHPLFEALARESDRPRRSLHVIVPFLATAAGGVISSALFGAFAIVGFAVGGCADALAEPIGIRFGKHRYRVPALGGVTCHRSLEGSAAVCAAAFVAALVALSLVGGEPAYGRRMLLAAATVAVLSTLVEAFSPHGLDNLTLQVAASAAAYLIATGA